MPNNPEMSKFLYTIVKQLDLKSVLYPFLAIQTCYSMIVGVFLTSCNSRFLQIAETRRQIDWNQVSSELGITNGHAARMRYSRFKQQMEGNTPVRRPRNTAPKKKRPKDKDNKTAKSERSERSLSTGDQMQGSFVASQESHDPTIPQTNVKSEPQEDLVSHPVSAEVPFEVPVASYSHSCTPLQATTLLGQLQQLESTHHGLPGCEAEFPFNTAQEQDIYNQMNYMGLTTAPTVKVEESWNTWYSQT